MSNRTAWTGGNLNSGLSWTGLFSSSDINLISGGFTVLSSLADITNGTGLDMFMDISLKIVCQQTITVTTGANFAIYLMPLGQDGSTYGDGSITTSGMGGALARTPGVAPAAIFPLARTGNSLTLMAGFAQQVVIPPGSFRGAIQSNIGGFSLSASTASCYFRSYNIQLNN